MPISIRLLSDHCPDGGGVPIRSLDTVEVAFVWKSLATSILLPQWTTGHFVSPSGSPIYHCQVLINSAPPYIVAHEHTWQVVQLCVDRIYAASLPSKEYPNANKKHRQGRCLLSKTIEDLVFSCFQGIAVRLKSNQNKRRDPDRSTRPELEKGHQLTGLGLAAQGHPEKPVRFAREKYFPADWQLCTTQFLSLFHRFGYIYRPLSGSSWYSAEEKWKLTDSEILKAIACVHTKFYLGCRAGKTSRFAVLDIDAGSKFHSQKQLQRILSLLAKAGLTKASLYRSSYSGGWHLYIFFSEPINATDLRRQLLALFSLNGIEIGKGTLEIFPHRGDASQGQGLRLPLQPGWAWLNKETLEVEIERSALSSTKALELFIDALDGDCNTYQDFRRLKTYVQELEQRKSVLQETCDSVTSNVIPLRRAATLVEGEFANFVLGIFRQLPPGMQPDTWYKGRLFHLQGLSGPSQRAEAIFCLSHYLFYGDPSRALPALGYGYEEERKWAIEQFLETRNNGQSRDINAGKSDAVEQADRAANWRPAHKKDGARKFVAQQPIAWVRANVNRKLDARNRISAALTLLKAGNRSFTTVELQEAAACSRRTLYDHADIWRKDYEDLSEGFFSICTGEYNAVDGATSQESQPPSTTPVKFAPPGLLAARRIAEEISNRSLRDKKRKENNGLVIAKSAESEWHAKVASLFAEPLQTLSVERLKASLSVLPALLLLAPCEEDLCNLQTLLQKLRAELVSRLTGPKSLIVPETS